MLVSLPSTQRPSSDTYIIFVGAPEPPAGSKANAARAEENRACDNMSAIGGGSSTESE